MKLKPKMFIKILVKKYFKIIDKKIFNFSNYSAYSKYYDGYNEYKGVLLNNKCLRHSMNRIQSKSHRIGTYEINKIS